jgi:cytochrome b561
MLETVPILPVMHGAFHCLYANAKVMKRGLPERNTRQIVWAKCRENAMSRKASYQYSLIAILLHWAIAILILGVLVLGYVMTRPDIDPARQFYLFQWHKSFGLLVLALALVRVAQRMLARRVLPVEGLHPLEAVASSSTHRLLLLLTVAVPLAGWTVASVSTLDIPTFMFNLFVVPHLPLSKSGAAEDFWATVHATLAYGMLALVALHASAAIYHHVWRRDDVLMRMVGRRRRFSGEERS